jgi:cell division protease FtsH
MQLNPLLKNVIIVIVILIALGAIFSAFNFPTSTPTTTPLSQIVTDIDAGKVQKISEAGDELTVTYIGSKTAASMKEDAVSLTDEMKNLGVDATALSKVEIDVIAPKTSVWDWLTPILIFGILPLIVFGFFFYMMLRQAKTGAVQMFDFTRARARIFGAEGHDKQRITFKDVAGLKEAKEELVEIVDFLKFPQKYVAMGAKIPRGVLLVGSAGVGKTLLARAVAGEANVPFLSISGSEFVEMFVGVGSARVRDLFATAKKSSPSIIFIDELDAIGRHRGAGIGGGHDEREQTLNQILVEMDGFEKETGVIILAATNRPDILDPALMRPGRFDRKIILDPPDVQDREAILRIHSKDKPLAKNIDFKEVAERTPGFSGADLANVANEAALLAARHDKTQVDQKEFLEAIEKVMLGPERKSHILNTEEKKITAYHEAGHALVATFMPEMDAVRKISIIARGMAAGYTLQVPSEAKKMKTKTGFTSEIATLLGGCTAEKMIFGEMSTGASNDLVRASELARRMVKEYGMSSLGLITFGEKEEMVFLGKEISGQRNYSEKIAERIDNEVDMIIKDAQKKAEQILIKNRTMLEKVSKVLIEKEIIEKEEFEQLVRPTGKKI